jgi:phosphatidate cytidylyltransferase
MITSSTKKVENHSLKSKKVKTDLQKRLFSAIFLVILMVIYLLLPILHTEIMRKQEYESVVAIGLGSAGIFATICIIAFSI